MRQFVGIVLVRPGGCVLAQYRDNKPEILGPDTWCVTGGARDENDETLELTGVRELREETGYLADSEDLHLLNSDIYFTERGVQVERTIFWAWYDEVQEVGCREGQEIRFISRQELGTLKFYTGHENFLRLASEKGLTSGVEFDLGPA
ncbi:hypothetical protein A3A84_03530 [Candidatus Collierbacteria bacterium RIFCSPLOWO2_01_FULL_50_23]|nr:MAG: hypothetical protein A3A84_03530 [Candidatus Collierbacteria bacterium RIFCSPLOWO2_01_FULL_50_23]